MVPAVQAGAEVIVAGTSVFRDRDLKKSIQALRDAATYALYQKAHPEAYESQDEPRTERI
jgi:hypothetical protein